MRFGSAFLLFIKIIVMVAITYGAEPTGSISGEVVSQRTHDQVVGAFVIVEGTSYGTITATYWNRINRKEDFIHQWGMMPILGVEFEF